MGRISKSGRYIISAAEVGSFVVCQEAWRLKELGPRNFNRSAKSIEGGKLHRNWASQIEEVNFLSHSAKMIVLLILVAIMFQLLSKA